MEGTLRQRNGRKVIKVTVRERAAVVFIESSRVSTSLVMIRMCRGAADYLVLAGQCSAVYLQDVPMFTYAMRNEARRFITLIDALYENKYVLHAC